VSARRVERPTQINSPTVKGWKRQQRRDGIASGSLRGATARNARTRELRFRRQTTAADEGRDGGGSIQGNNIRCHREVCVCCAKRGKRRLRSFQRSNLPLARPSSSRRRGMEKGVSGLYYTTTVAVGR